MRDQRARISNYAEMISTAVMTIAVIGLAHVLRNHFALIYGTIFQRALLTLGSYFFYRDIGVGIAFDRETVAEQFKFARFVLPSSLLYILVSQFDKVVLLKLFNLSLLGIYGIASNMIAPIAGVVVHNAQVILYARCAEYFRTDRSTACSRYYRENRRLLMAGALLPAILAGFSPLIVAILYDPRYILAGHIAMILGLGAIIGSFQNASENLLVASGRTHTTLVANAFRVCSIVPLTLSGYFLFGFEGYLWFGLIATIPVMGYYYSSQKKYGLLNFKSEIQLLLSALLVFLICLGISHLLLRLLPTEWLHLRMKSH
jgi:O-antigen/teichoic acid export membrane protein